MLRRSIVLSVLLAAALVAPRAELAAQDKEQPVVRTYRLRHLKAVDAAKLIAPYIQSAFGGVFEVGGQPAITVREHARVLAVVDSLLREYDRAPRGVQLRFQLIATSDSAHRDPAIAPVEAALRGLFRFNGYRLLAQGSAVANERSPFALTMAAEQKRYRVEGMVGAVAGGATPEATLNVTLSESDPPLVVVTDARVASTMATVLSTGLTIPFGQTVVLGSGSPTKSRQVLILVVLPELLPQRP